MKKIRWFPFAATTGLLVGTILVGGMTDRRIPEPLAIPLDRIDSDIAGWTQIEQQQLDAPTLRVLDPTAYLSRTYQKGSSHIGLFIAYYAQQRAGESMHSPQHCLPGAGWEIMKRDSVTIPVGDQRVVVNKYRIENLGTKMLMLYWYQSRSRIVASEYQAKILLVRDTALTGHTAGSIVRVMLPDDEAATNEAVTFASRLIPSVQRCLGYDRTSPTK